MQKKKNPSTYTVGRNVNWCTFGEQYGSSLKTIMPTTEESIKKMCYIYTMEYHSAINKNEIMPFAATWTDLESVILSEVSRTEKKNYDMYVFYVESKKKMIQINLQNRRRLTDLENELMVAGGEGIVREIGTVMYTF